MPTGANNVIFLTDRPIKNCSTCAELESIYGEVLQQNSTLRDRLDQIKPIEQNPPQAKRARREVAKLEREIVRSGIVRDGQRYYPANNLLGSKQPGIEWREGAAEALSRKKERGQFGSLQDVYFAIQKGAELGLGTSAVFHFPPNHSSIVYVPKQIGTEVLVEAQAAKYVLVKVGRTGKVAAHPSLTIKPASPVRYAEKPSPIVALKYRQISHLADDVPKITSAVDVSQDLITAVKNHLFLSKHLIQVGPNQEISAFFTPTKEIADWWLKAIDDILSRDEEVKFRRILAHEYVERGLMAAGLPYRSRSEEAWSQDAEGDFIPLPTSTHYGAHDLAPHQDAERRPFLLWKELFKLPAEGLELADDLSNLDQVIEEMLRRVQFPT